MAQPSAICNEIDSFRLETMKGLEIVEMATVPGRSWVVFPSAVLLSVLLAAPTSTTPAQGRRQEPFEKTRLIASGGKLFDSFGRAVSLFGDTALIGAPFTDKGPDVTYVGSAYVFERRGGEWTQQAKLMASDGGAFDLFGTSVSIFGNTALIGARLKDAAYVFVRRDGVWVEEAKLTPGEGDGLLGTSVSLFEDTALVGAPIARTSRGVWAGAAYVFVRKDGVWARQAKLEASDGEDGDSFGEVVSLYGSTALVGAPWDGNENGYDAGSAYVFVRREGSWTAQAKLLASDGETDDDFGWSVSLFDDTAVMGAIGDGDNGEDAGAAYVFVRDGAAWSEQAKLVASDGEENDWFGDSVSVFGDLALIGVVYDDHGIWSNSGSAYLYLRDGGSWTEETMLLPSQPRTADVFGWSVSLSVDTALVGSPGDSVEDVRGVGSAYVFEPSYSTLRDAEVSVEPDR